MHLQSMVRALDDIMLSIYQTMFGHVRQFVMYAFFIEQTCPVLTSVNISVFWFSSVC